uniref:Uncharacterized protein n=1 Tax=Megaselia scalaris TaxID=36166 RepID=T1H2U4_MEGSC
MITDTLPFPLWKSENPTFISNGSYKTSLSPVCGHVCFLYQATSLRAARHRAGSIHLSSSSWPIFLDKEGQGSCHFC